MGSTASVEVASASPTLAEGEEWTSAVGLARIVGLMPSVLARHARAVSAWAAADNALQIHGGNGFALEYQISRILCDARILNIFEGAAEIQAQVIARRLLG